MGNRSHASDVQAAPARRIALAVLLVLAALALPRRAAAQEVSEARDFPVERFQLSLDRNGLLAVEWAGLPARGSWEINAWLGAANDPLVINRDEQGVPVRVGALVASRVGGELGLSLALLSRLQLGVNLSMIVHQNRDAMIDGVDGELAPLENLGLGDLRITPKLALLRGGLDVALIPEFTVPSALGEDYRGETSFSFAPALAFSASAGPLRLALNLGWRFRERSQVADLIVDDELFGRAGIGIRFGEPGDRLPLELDLTLSGATGADDPLGAANREYAEVLGGVSLDLGSHLQLFGAGGVGLNQGFGTPDWRGLGGLRVGNMGGPARDPDPDRDGILGIADLCPAVAEDRDDFEDPDGCPDPDNDEDQVLDVDDGAPLIPEDRDGFADTDGVPDPDNDGDGVDDAVDACPNDAENTNQYQDEDGCPDTIPDGDGDGLGDNVDQCPGEAEDADGFEDEDGCADADNDRDGVIDSSDNCPLEAGVIENRGCPDTDRDGDTVVDRLDNCPDEAGPVRNHGCKAKQLVVIHGDRLDILDVVYFKVGKDIIQARSYKLLDNVAQVIVAHPEIKRLRIGGHTDDVGDDASNLDLSQRRADAVMSYLVDAGVEAERLEARGYGESVPVGTNKTKRGRAANRRVVFEILGEVDANAPIAPTGAPGDGTTP